MIFNELTPKQYFVNRMSEALTKYPGDIKKEIVDQFPEYNSYNGHVKLMNALAGRIADVRLTEIVEWIANGKPEVKQAAA